MQNTGFQSFSILWNRISLIIANKWHFTRYFFAPVLEELFYWYPPPRNQRPARSPFSHLPIIAAPKNRNPNRQHALVHAKRREKRGRPRRFAGQEEVADSPQQPRGYGYSLYPVGAIVKWINNRKAPILVLKGSSLCRCCTRIECWRKT